MLELPMSGPNLQDLPEWSIYHFYMSYFLSEIYPIMYHHSDTAVVLFQIVVKSNKNVSETIKYSCGFLTSQQFQLCNACYSIYSSPKTVNTFSCHKFDPETCKLLAFQECWKLLTSTDTTPVAQQPKNLWSLFNWFKGPTLNSVTVLSVRPLTGVKPDSLTISITQPSA